jgi:selenocysteine lyase/cysteine desulfurase
MREVQQHNGMLARYFTEQVYKHKLGRHVAHSAEKRRRTPKTWSWNGIATVIFDTPDIPLLLQKENRQLQFTQLGTEKWRDDLGGIPPGQRYSLDPDCLDVNNMRVPKHPFEVANFTELHVPKIEGYPARFCFHYYHSTSDVDRLITRLKEASRHIKSIGRPKVMKRPT